MIQAPWKQKDKNSKLLLFRAWKIMYRMLCSHWPYRTQQNLWSCRRGGYCRRFVGIGNPWNISQELSPFLFQWFVSDTHCKKKNIRRPQGWVPTLQPSKQKVSHNQSARSTAAPSNTWFGWTLLTCEGLTFVGESQGLSYTIPNISRMKSCREMQKNLEHQKPTHTQWYSVSKTTGASFVLTFLIW